MNIKTCYLTFINYELCQGCLIQLWAFYINLRNTHTIRWDSWNDSESLTKSSSIQHRSRRAIKVTWNLNISNVSICSCGFAIFNNSHLNLKLRRIAESLSVSFYMSDEIKTVLHIITANEAAFKCYNGKLLIRCDVDLNNSIIFRLYVKILD